MRVKNKRYFVTFQSKNDVFFRTKTVIFLKYTIKINGLLAINPFYRKNEGFSPMN